MRGARSSCTEWLQKRKPVLKKRLGREQLADFFEPGFGNQFEQMEHVSELRALKGWSVIARAIVAAVADGKAFRNGRQLSAGLGLLRLQDSTGDKQRAARISKRRNSYL